MKKTIIFVVTTPFAVNAFLRNHLLALAKQYEVILCVNLGAYPLLTELRGALTVIDIGIQRKVSILQDLKVLLKLIKIIRNKRPDAVHSLTPKAGLLAMLAGWISSVSLRSHTFTGQIWVTQKGWKRFVLKQMDRLIVWFSTNTLVDSGSQRQLLVREKIGSASSIEMLGNGSIAGVDINRFCPNTTLKSKNRKTFGVAADVCVYIFVGRINRDKGIYDLMKAFQEVATTVPKVELWVVGPDEENVLPTLKVMSETCDAPIRFFKETPEPEILMASADIMLLPSFREGFGVVIIESAACEIPTIAYRIEGVVDAVQEGHTGILVDAGDVESFASAMKALAADASLRRCLGKQARDRARRIFDSDAVTDKWVDFYNREFRRIDSV
jgi:glycosyltransferase involved in cell wall biosynthesis